MVVSVGRIFYTIILWALPDKHGGYNLRFALPGPIQHGLTSGLYALAAPV